MNKDRNLIIVSTQQKETLPLISFCYSKGISISWTAYDFNTESHENNFLEKSLEAFSTIQKPILTVHNGCIMYIDNIRIQYVFLDNSQDNLLIKQEINLLNSYQNKSKKESEQLKIFESENTSIEKFCDWYLNEYEKNIQAN